MATDTSEIRSTLNNLIETLKDGEEGFRSAAEKLKNSSARAQFQSWASERARFASELQGAVTAIGGEATTSGSASGALHRGWMGLKSALTGNDDHAIIAEAERGEDVAVSSFRDAMAKDLPSDLRSIIERQFRGIQAAHNAVRSLRDATNMATSGISTGSSTY
ncbi:MAG: PA2169 family four-helix-bundle protein [Terriglobia bacterium]